MCYRVGYFHVELSMQKVGESAGDERSRASPFVGIGNYSHMNKPFIGQEKNCQLDTQVHEKHLRVPTHTHSRNTN